MSDVLRTNGVVSLDPNTTGWVAGQGHNPTYANDGNDGTTATWDASVQAAGTFRGFEGTLDAQYVISTIGLFSQDNKGSGDYTWYSTDGSSWSGGEMGSVNFPGSWDTTVSTVLCTFTLTTPITARYWRYDRVHGGGFGGDVQVKTWSLNGSGVVLADFSGTPLTGTEPLTVVFTDLSTGSPTSWLWDFGDGSTSTSQNPSHSYSYGTYTVTLTATNAGGSDSEIKTAYVVVTVYRPGVWVDWDNDGFSESGTVTTEAGLLARMMPEGGTQAVSDNITTECMSFTWQRGGTSDLLGGSGTDSATIIVKNTLGKYNPDNTNSTIYGKLKPGKPVWIGVNADGTLSGTGQTVYGIFAGRLREIAPIAAGGATDAPTTELICDGILVDYGQTPVRVSESTTRSQKSFRQAVLTAIGETRSSLADEPDTLPLSSADSTDALSVLEELNRSSGSKHTIVPSASLTSWYSYTSYNRQYHLGSTTSASLNAGTQHVTAIDGLRLNAETVINDQRATVDPATVSPGLSVVWTYDKAPFHLTGNLVLWAEFDDFVQSPILNISTASGSVTSALTSFGHSAKITLYSSGAQISTLTVEGHALVRESAVTVSTDFLPEAAPSQAAYGVRSGSPLSGDLLGSQASAQGLVEHIVFRYHEPLRRPSVTVVNWLPTMFSTALYDVLAVTVTQFDMAARWFDVLGIEGSCDVAASASLIDWEITYQLQESSLQAVRTWFTWDTSVWNGPDTLAY